MSAVASPKKISKTFVITGIILALSFLYQLQDEKIIDIGLRKEVKNTVGIFYEVTRVVDGDTIEILMGGRKEKIRLIGINTPEMNDERGEVQCFAEEAKDRMKELVSGKIIKLEYDETQNLRDTYNRILAYIYLEDEQMLNRKMIAEGYAYEYTYIVPYKYQKEFRELQLLAKNNDRGLWAENTCNGKK